MRILGVADASLIHTRKWASYFAGRGHRVRLLSVAPPAPDQPASPGIEVDPAPLPALHLKRVHITLAGVARVRRILREFQPDLVHAHFLGPGAWYAALARARPLVISVMGGGDVRGTTWKPGSLAERLLTPYALKRASLVTCWSPTLKDAVAGMVRATAPCEVILGGVDVDRFRRRDDVGVMRARLGLPEDAFVVLGARLLWPLHNADVLVRAVHIVRREFPQIRLILLRYKAEAFPDYERALRELVAELGVADVVQFLPAQANEDMPRLYSLVSCTASIPNVDGTPMTVMESLACGTPAVVSDLPDYDPELFVDGATVLRVPHQSAEALAAAFLRLSRDGPLRERLGKIGRETVERRVSYESEMGRLEGLYDRVLARVSNGSKRPS